MEKGLSEGEKLVLLALVEDATRTDAEVAETTGLRETTAGRHRRNLVRDGNLSFANYPAFHQLGCELLAEYFGRTNPAIPLDDRNGLYKAFLARTPQVFDSVAGEGFLMASAAFRDVADMLMLRDQHDDFFEGYPMSKGLLKTALFPFDISHCSYFYNFGPCLKRIFQVDIPDVDARPLERLRRKEPDLSKAEVKFLLALLEMPMATDAKIGVRIGRSRQSVTEMRNELIERGLFVRMAVPTLRSVDFAGLAYVHLRFKPSFSLERKNSLAGEEWWRQSCYTLERNAELFSIYPFGGFREYNSLVSRCIKPFADHGALSEEPEVFVISRENMVDLVDCSFAPLVKRLFAGGIHWKDLSRR